MNGVLNIETLAAMGVRFAILSSHGYALPVRFRVRGAVVECRVPTWSGVGDLLEETGEVTLVAAEETGRDPCLRWLFIRGSAAVVPHPDWQGLVPPRPQRLATDDLYQLVRVEPKRIELIDEQRGWGVRETIDL